MSEYQLCPECEGPVVGFGDDTRCTQCGLTYLEMDEIIGEDARDGLNDDEYDTDELEDSDSNDSGESGDSDSTDW
jgi:hypothetical protein